MIFAPPAVLVAGGAVCILYVILRYTLRYTLKFQRVKSPYIYDKLFCYIYRIIAFLSSEKTKNTAKTEFS